MQNEVVIAGFGGQGVLSAGQILAYSAMEEGHHVVWLPSYGPEMRGGTANCTVTISDAPIASPIITNPGSAIVMNNPSLDRFGPAVRSGGTVIINNSLVTIPFARDDVQVLLVPANAMAQELGNPKAANMIILGAYIGATHAVKLDTLKSFVSKKFASKHTFIELNLRAIDAGYSKVKEQLS